MPEANIEAIKHPVLSTTAYLSVRQSFRDKCLKGGVQVQKLSGGS